MAKGDFAGDQIIAPHAAEPIIIKRAGLVDIGHEAIMPMAQGAGVMQPPALNIAGKQPLVFYGSYGLGHPEGVAANCLRPRL